MTRRSVIAARPAAACALALALALVAGCNPFQTTVGCPDPVTGSAFGGTWRGDGVTLLVGHHTGKNACGENIGLVELAGSSEEGVLPWTLLSASGEVVESTNFARAHGDVWTETASGMPARLSTATVEMEHDIDTMAVTIEYRVDGADRQDDLDLTRETEP